MSYYRELTSDKVIATNRLIKFLRRLRVVGSLQIAISTKTTIQSHFWVDEHIQEVVYDGTGPARYDIEKLSYSYERTIDQEELLESIFGRLSLGIGTNNL